MPSFGVLIIQTFKFLCIYSELSGCALERSPAESLAKSPKLIHDQDTNNEFSSKFICHNY